MKKWWLRFAKYTSITLVVLFLLAFLIVFRTGDGGYTQKIISGIEKRAFEKKSTWTDKMLLKGLYQGMIYTGYWQYPYASQFLHHYCQSKGDTLFFNANFLLENPEVQEALRNKKRAIIFRSVGRSAWEGLHVSKNTYWDFFYAFDLIFIKQIGKKIIFQDHYYFSSLEKRSYTPFAIGKIRFFLNDGLIHTAYPKAKSYISYGIADIQE